MSPASSVISLAMSNALMTYLGNFGRQDGLLNFVGSN